MDDTHFKAFIILERNSLRLGLGGEKQILETGQIDPVEAATAVNAVPVRMTCLFRVL